LRDRRRKHDEEEKKENDLQCRRRQLQCVPYKLQDALSMDIAPALESKERILRA